MAQLMTRLKAIMSVMKVFEDNPELKQTRTRYLVEYKTTWIQGRLQSEKKSWVPCGGNVSMKGNRCCLYTPALERKVALVYSIGYFQKEQPS